MAMDGASWDERVDLCTEGAKEEENDAGGGDTVDIIIAEDEDALVRGESLLDACDSGSHPRDQEGIVEMFEAGSQESFGVVRCCDASINEQSSQGGVEFEFVDEVADEVRVGAQHLPGLLRRRFARRRDLGLSAHGDNGSRGCRSVRDPWMVTQL